MFVILWLLAVVLVSKKLKSIPNARLTEVVWQVFTAVMPSKEVKELRAVRDELMRVRQERSNTSSQDEFAKWARLDREHLALKKKYDAMNANVGHLRQKVTWIVRGYKWVSTSGFKLLVQFYYRRTPIVWVPFEALPSIVERILAFPMAPKGSISVVFWLFATDTSVSAMLNLYKGWKNRK